MNVKKQNHAKNLSILMLFVMIFSCGLVYNINICDAVSAGNEIYEYGDSNNYIEAAALPSQLFVCGVPIGIQMQSDGVIVTGFLGFKNEKDEYVNPSLDAGILVGDRIVALSGTEVHSTEDLQKCVAESRGKCDIGIIRNNEPCTITMSPDVSAENHQLKLGLWVKDKTAGIGTLTFVDPENGSYGALGHGIGNGESHGLFAMSDGLLYDAAIGGSIAGRIGHPGELQGYFLNDDKGGIGSVELNTDKGVYGTVNSDVLDSITDYGKLIHVAYGDSIKVGNATIYSTISGTTPKEYSVEIESINDSSNCSGIKTMSIHITDEELLAATGGIVQGMSGSPVIQNGKLVGAVTHVLVNDPTRGYAIFIENMLETANQVAEEQANKDAS